MSDFLEQVARLGMPEGPGRATGASPGTTDGPAVLPRSLDGPDPATRWDRRQARDGSDGQRPDAEDPTRASPSTRAAVSLESTESGRRRGTDRSGIRGDPEPPVNRIRVAAAGRRPELVDALDVRAPSVASLETDVIPRVGAPRRAAVRSDDERAGREAGSTTTTEPGRAGGTDATAPATGAISAGADALADASMTTPAAARTRAISAPALEGVAPGSAPVLEQDGEPRDPADVPAPAGASASVATAVRPGVEPSDVVRIEPRLVPAEPPDRIQLAAVPSAAEKPGVEVRIGRVAIEVRPQAPRRSLGAAPGGRFDGIVAARRFADRRWY